MIGLVSVFFQSRTRARALCWSVGVVWSVGRRLVDSVTVWFKSIHVEKLEKQKTLPEKEGKSETWLLKLIEEHKCSYSRSPLDILTRGTYI